jgi:hypothetical protein
MLSDGHMVRFVSSVDQRKKKRPAVFSGALLCRAL